MKRIWPIFFVLLLLTACCFVLWTSLDFQECIKSYGKNNPTGQHLQKGISGVVLTYRHCAGAYVVEKNPVITALGTVVIAIFTTILGIFTIRLSESTRIAAQAAKQATDTAREEFIATHRPRIKIHIAEFKHNLTNTEGVYSAGASLLCFNVGESTAKNVEVRGEIYAGDGFAPDVLRPLVLGIPKLKSGIKFRAEIKSDWPAGDVVSGPRRGQPFYCLGWIAYEDGNGLRRETGFCFVANFQGAGDRWVSAKKPEYEYEY
jgi:hypothetical protein